jgi:hypothetical protein
MTMLTTKKTLMGCTSLDSVKARMTVIYGSSEQHYWHKY